MYLSYYFYVIGPLQRLRVITLGMLFNIHMYYTHVLHMPLHRRSG